MVYYINYNKAEMTIFANHESFKFDLKEGDIGEFWHSFEFEGEVFDVNMHQDSADQVPSVSIYKVEHNQVLWDTCTPLVGWTMGKAENYFNPVDITLSWGLFY